MSQGASLPLIFIGLYLAILVILLVIGKVCFKWKMAFYKYLLIAAVLFVLTIVITGIIVFDSSHPVATPQKISH